MARESQGRTVHIVSVGSASATGPEAMNSRLAEERARAPIAVLDHYLVNVPHEYHNIYGTGDTYSPRSVSAQEHRRYQHVHLVAYFEGELSPSRQIPPQPATMPVLAATAAPIPKAPPVSGTFTSGAPGSRFTNMVGMDFVQLPPGVFTLGSPSSEYGHSEKERAHQVSLTKGFYIQTTEVTQGQWEAVMGENPSHFQICGSDCPVEQVSWFDVQRFIQRLNEMEQTRTYRLPTEAEWEYACRAGSSTAYANGGTIKDDTCGHNEALESLGWYFRNSELGTHPVARKQPNAWGLYDMHGNVWEWCRDWQAKYPFTPVTDPIGPEKGFHKIRRGGSWSHYPMYCRSAYRSWYDPDNRTAEIGFRLVRDLKESPEPAPVRSMPAPQPAREPVDSPRVSEECIILHDVTFALDSAEIRPAMVPILDKVAQMLMTNPRRITLTGHTCSLATNKYNQRLSERRVETVRRELVRRGLDPSRITTGAMGETHPRYDNSTEAGRSLNRRVEIRIR
jgi:formylglycine-generating enzyme required for sulfatase activity